MSEALIQYQIIQYSAFAILTLILITNIQQKTASAHAPFILGALGVAQFCLGTLNGEPLIEGQAILNNAIIAMLIIAPCYALGFFQEKDTALIFACCAIWSTENYIIMCSIAILSFICLQMATRFPHWWTNNRLRLEETNKLSFNTWQQLSPSSLLSLGCITTFIG